MTTFIELPIVFKNVDSPDYEALGIPEDDNDYHVDPMLLDINSIIRVNPASRKGRTCILIRDPNDQDPFYHIAAPYEQVEQALKDAGCNMFKIADLGISMKVILK